MNWGVIIAIGWGVLAPLATWGLTEGKYRLIEMPAARSAAAIEATEAATKACNKRIGEIEQQLAAKAAEARRLAEEAERSIGPTPVEKAELQLLCQKSASCRERNQIGGAEQ